MEQKSKESEFEIKYHKANDYKTHFATGVIGGGTLNGLINLNFFVDTVKLPGKVVRKLQGELISPEEILEESTLGSNRELLVGILIDINTAKVVEKWLHDRIELQENEMKKVKVLRK